MADRPTTITGPLIEAASFCVLLLIASVTFLRPEHVAALAYVVEASR